MADIHPGVFRFGGCIVEGTDLATRYDWKKSVGPVENRPLNENRWQYTFTHRFFLIITKATDWDFMNTSCCPKKWGGTASYFELRIVLSISE